MSDSAKSFTPLPHRVHQMFDGHPGDVANNFAYLARRISGLNQVIRCAAYNLQEMDDGALAMAAEIATEEAADLAELMDYWRTLYTARHSRDVNNA